MVITTKKASKLVTTTEAGATFGLEPGWIARLCRTGKLQGQRIGRDWAVNPESVKTYLAGKLKPGRPSNGQKKKRGAK